MGECALKAHHLISAAKQVAAAVCPLSIVKRVGLIRQRAMANELAALSALKKEPALAALKEGSEAEQVGPAAKRVCLRHYDLSPAQLLNPMGASGVGELPLATYWTLLCKGNKKAAAFSELCFEDPSRRKVGMSRACDVLSQAIHQLETDEYLKIVLSPEVRAAALTEAQTLKPHLDKLNSGKTAQKLGSIRNVAYWNGSETSGEAPGEADVKAVREWCLKDNSVLRSLIACLSSGGIWFTAQCHEKTLRAFVHHGGGSQEARQESSTEAPFSRMLCQRPCPAASSDAAALKSL